jgi:GNAT superfamily N-acetyltransferase
MFKDHHYLDSELNKAARCYVAVWDDQVIGFVGVITMPSGTLKNAWRSHRTVVLPDFQGMGIGVRLSNAIGQIHLDQGHRFFSRTAHPRMGYYREHSSLWKPTSKNLKLRKDVTIKNMYKENYFDNKRVCFSHEYVGEIKTSTSHEQDA